MTETFSRVKSSLVALLSDPEHKVIALKGKWGTGKTYLWRSVAAELFSGKKATEQPIYVSLFGAKSINDLKLRILQNAYLKDASTLQKLMKTSGGFAKQILQKYTGYSAEDAALLWLPELVAGRLIVIDDVERKHKSLDIDELLGLIDEYSEIHLARFLILLNTDKLIDTEDMWATLHEKVIDVEVVLDPSAAESFDVAAQGNSNQYLPVVRATIATLKVNNIRVIKRVLRTIQRVVDASGVDDAPTSRWVPSTVLLTASHYRAVDNAPPFEYLKSFNSFSRMFRTKDQPPGPTELKSLDWDALLQKLGIHSADDYEDTVQEYLQSGLLDVSRLKIIFDLYKKEAFHAAASAQREEFFTAVRWDPNRNEDELLAMAKALLPTVDVMDPGAITDIVFLVGELGDSALARQFLDAWLLAIETRPEYQKMGEQIFESAHRKFHPDVIGKMNAMRDNQHPPLTVVETAERIVKNSGWGEREKIALQRSTVQQYEDALKEIANDTLRRFLMEHLGWVRNGPYDDNFKNGADNFVAACYNICSATPDSRLSRIIYDMFQGHGLAAKLPQPAAVAESGTY